MNEESVIIGLNKCSGSCENCSCPYSDIVAGSCVSALCLDALKLIEKLKHAEGETPAREG